MSNRPICGFGIGALLAVLSLALAGSPCPRRLHPCMCQSVPHEKTTFTWVVCHRLQSTDSLASVLPVLKEMNIDKLSIYASFWEASTEKQALPTDWLSLRVREFEIFDSRLSSSFVCNVDALRCSNSVITKFLAVNSSSSESISTLCNTTHGNRKVSWIGCMANLQSFVFQQGRLAAVQESLFPLPLAQLREVDLSHNSISKVETEAFKNTPGLRVLDLSHNRLKDLLFLNDGPAMKLEKLFISHNLIKTVGSKLFPNLPSLKTLVISNNEIVFLKEAEWKLKKGVLKRLDINENPIRCDCSIRWINTTYPTTAFWGKCKAPEHFKNIHIQQASAVLNTKLPKNITCEEWMKQYEK